MNLCKGVCPPTIPTVKHGSMFGLGYKFCKICGIFIKYDGIWCPCCSTKLRTKPKTSKAKSNLIQYKANKKIEDMD